MSDDHRFESMATNSGNHCRSLLAKESHAGMLHPTCASDPLSLSISQCYFSFTTENTLSALTRAEQSSNTITADEETEQEGS